MNEIVYDIEANGFIFESTKIWTIHFYSKLLDEWLVVNPFKDGDVKEKIVDFIFQADDDVRIISHNGLGYDQFVLKKLLDVDFTVGPDTLEGRNVEFVDTYYLSMFLNPDRQGHSIEHFGEILGYPKIDYRQELIDHLLLPKDAPDGAQFLKYDPLMEKYCRRDVEVGLKTYEYLLKEWEDVYHTPFSKTQAFSCGQKSFFLMSCQELTGWKFDIELAKELHSKITKEMQEIADVVEAQLPERELKKTEQAFYTMPAKPYRADGRLSANMTKWVEKHNGKILSDTEVECYGKKYQILSKQMLDVKKPMEISNQAQIKEYLISLGWKPKYYNFKRDEYGKPARDHKGKIITTTPKLQEQGQIDPGLLEMNTGIVKDIVKWLSLRNRASVIEGWLSDPRLEYDGRIGAGRSGITNTHRERHKKIANLPRPSEDVLYGKEMRTLFTSEEGMLVAAADASALEGRVQGSYTYRYDNGDTANRILIGDVHANTAKALFPEETKDFDVDSPDFDKHDPVFKPFRDMAKKLSYAIMYGSGNAKAAEICHVPVSRGEEMVEKYWQANSATKELRDNIEKWWKRSGNEKYLPAIDGRILLTRKQNALLNMIFQSCGAITMDYACCFLDHWLGKMHFDDKFRPYYLYKGKIARRICYYHDEIEFECDEEIAQDIANMIVKAIVKAGEFVKLRVPLAAEGQVGKDWSSH